MTTHNVRGTASGEYECSCGARWDRDEGDKCPTTLAVSELPGMREPSDLSGGATDCEPKEAVSAGDDRKKFETRFNLRNLNKGQDEDGDIFYFDDWVQGAWIGWQARGESNA